MHIDRAVILHGLRRVGSIFKEDITHTLGAVLVGTLEVPYLLLVVHVRRCMHTHARCEGCCEATDTKEHEKERDERREKKIE